MGFFVVRLCGDILCIFGVIRAQKKRRRSVTPVTPLLHLFFHRFYHIYVDFVCTFSIIFHCYTFYRVLKKPSSMLTKKTYFVQKVSTKTRNKRVFV